MTFRGAVVYAPLFFTLLDILQKYSTTVVQNLQDDIFQHFEIRSVWQANFQY